jgi:hypothetical protein
VALRHALRRGTIVSDVKLLATWDGWCDPCGTERPLVLVEIGPRGVRAWLGGVGTEDRTLHLTCRVCGQWQAVPQLEEDDELAPIEQLEAPSTPVAYDPLAIARTSVRTAGFDGTVSTPTDPPARRASDAAPAKPEAPAAEVADAVAETAAETPAELETVAELEPPDAPAAKALARWFAKKAVAAEQDVLDEVILAAAEDEAVETPKRSRWFARKAVEVEETEVTEDSDEVSAAIAEDVLPSAPKRRWFRAPATPAVVDEATEEPAAAEPVPAILSVAVRPTAASVPVRPTAPAPRAVAPDVEKPERPAFTGMRPTSVGPSAQTRQVPLPRTYRSTVRAASATDTAPLALLAAGYDVVAAGSR